MGFAGLDEAFRHDWHIDVGVWVRTGLLLAECSDRGMRERNNVLDMLSPNVGCA